MKKHIPNFLTLCNVACGFCGLVAALYFTEIKIAALFMVIGLFFDFLDGMVARLLKVSGELGKQLDSLADAITFGALPGALVFEMLGGGEWALVAILIPVLSVLRLAKFNLDTRQSDSFIGLATPSHALFWMGLAGHFNGAGITENLLLWAGGVLVMSALLVSNIPMFSFKLKSLKWTGNEVQFLFLGLAAVVACLCIFLWQIPFLSISIIILLYIIISIINNLFSKTHEVQS
jgi:CDP-diacylglycerol--serine O-phosphatidyltransferase